MTSSWTPASIPDQSGRTAVVTGPSLGGLGHHTALELARKGARVVLAGRTARKLDETARAIRDEVPAAAVEQLEVDLADQSSVAPPVPGPLHSARSTCSSTTRA